VGLVGQMGLEAVRECLVNEDVAVRKEKHFLRLMP
jgi:hypothetical protein